MTHFTIEHVVLDDRFINPAGLGHNITRHTICKGKADNDEIALSEAEKICGPLVDAGVYSDATGRKYRTWVRHHKLHSEYKFCSELVAIFKTEL